MKTLFASQLCKTIISFFSTDHKLKFPRQKQPLKNLFLNNNFYFKDKASESFTRKLCTTNNKVINLILVKFYKEISNTYLTAKFPTSARTFFDLSSNFSNPVSASPINFSLCMSCSSKIAFNRRNLHRFHYYDPARYAFWHVVFQQEQRNIKSFYTINFNRNISAITGNKF